MRSDLGTVELVSLDVASYVFHILHLRLIRMAVCPYFRIEFPSYFKLLVVESMVGVCEPYGHRELGVRVK